MKTKTKPRELGVVRDRVNFNECVKQWVSYYRQNIHRFALDYLGLPLFPFQMILLFMMDVNDNFFYVASRGEYFLAPLHINM